MSLRIRRIAQRAHVDPLCDRLELAERLAVGKTVPVQSVYVRELEDLLSNRGGATIFLADVPTWRFCSNWATSGASTNARRFARTATSEMWPTVLQSPAHQQADPDGLTHETALFAANTYEIVLESARRRTRHDARPILHAIAAPNPQRFRFQPERSRAAASRSPDASCSGARYCGTRSVAIAERPRHGMRASGLLKTAAADYLILSAGNFAVLPGYGS